MSRIARWWVAGLVVVAVFAVTTWVSGAFILASVLASSADRWVVASAIGVALAAFAALWGNWWATREDGPDPGPAGGDRSGRGPVIAGGDRSAAVGGDSQGIISTGDDAVNIQDR